METLIHQSQKGQQSYLLLEEGGKIEVTDQHFFSGGGATNAAVSLKKLGLDVSIFCKIGKDLMGEVLLDELKSYDLDLSHVLYSKDSGTASSFVIPSLSGDRVLFAYRGANATLLSRDLPSALIAEADFLYITSLSKASAKRLPEIVQTAKDNHTRVTINPGSSQLSTGCNYLKDSLANIDTLIMNLEEAQLFSASLGETRSVSTDEHEQILGETSGAPLGLREFFKLMFELGLSIVVVTNGEDGVYVCTPEKLLFHPAMKADVKNTLGAGDAFGSTFAGVYESTGNIAQAIRCGVVNSAAVCAEMSAKGGLLAKADIESKAATLDDSLLTELPWG